MSQHDILFSITQNARDGINFQVYGSEISNVLNQKEEVLEVMERLRQALINEAYPFTNPEKQCTLQSECAIE